jgi:two-component sensor histidine kinase
VREAIAKAIGEKSTFQFEHRVQRADGSVGWTLSRAVPILDAQGNITEWFGAASDVTVRREAEEQLRRSSAERDSLLKEVHHRVKNNLRVIDSLLSLQADECGEKSIRAVLQDTSSRGHVIAEIHRLRYGSADLANVDIRAFIEGLCGTLARIYHTGTAHEACILIDSECRQVHLERAVPLGLILDEATTRLAGP